MEASNVKAMREALCEIVLLTLKVGKSISADIACGIIASKAKHALKKPPRNCDRFKTVKDAAIEYAKVVAGETTPVSDFAFSTWLFAPAEEGGEG